MQLILKVTYSPENTALFTEELRQVCEMEHYIIIIFVFFCDARHAVHIKKAILLPAVFLMEYGIVVTPCTPFKSATADFTP